MIKIPRTVWMLGLVSLFTDVSSEMIAPLLPVFLAGTLGASAIQLGLIEGVAETTSSLIKVLSGIWTDRSGNRKPFLVFGYSISGFFRPLIGLAHTWQIVLLLRFFDRVGKGIRSSPRDALIADQTSPENRGAAYGVQRAMDHLGATLGPLVASALLFIPGMTLRNVFLLASIPAVVTVIILIFAVPSSNKPNLHSTSNPPRSLAKTFAIHPISDWQNFPPEYKSYLIALVVFALGNSTDAFLLIKLSDAGLAPTAIALLWSAHHVVKIIGTLFGGYLSDQIGRRSVLWIGWGYYAIIYGLFATNNDPHVLAVIFLAYGVYHGFVEPTERALVADIVPEHARGTAFGYYHFVLGIAALPASLLFGAIANEWGSSRSFLMGACLAGVASLLLVFSKTKNQPNLSV